MPPPKNLKERTRIIYKKEERRSMKKILKKKVRPKNSREAAITAQN